MKQWLAQQCRWPPALPVFPANREFYREFRKIAALGAPETTSNAVIAGLPTQIPYSTKQGIIFAEQEIWAVQSIFLFAFRNCSISHDASFLPCASHSTFARSSSSRLFRSNFVCARRPASL
jgi:hypothetical protein